MKDISKVEVGDTVERLAGYSSWKESHAGVRNIVSKVDGATLKFKGVTGGYSKRKYKVVEAAIIAEIY